MVHSWCTWTQQTPVFGNKTQHSEAIQVACKSPRLLLLSAVTCCNSLYIIGLRADF